MTISEQALAYLWISQSWQMERKVSKRLILDGRCGSGWIKCTGTA